VDTDRDRLSDQDEAIYRTDPKNPDTDGDGVPDGEEVIGGTDPNAIPRSRDEVGQGGTSAGTANEAASGGERRAPDTEAGA